MRVGRTVYVTADFAPLGAAKSATIAYHAASAAVRWITVNNSLGLEPSQSMARLMMAPPLTGQRRNRAEAHRVSRLVSLVTSACSRPG